MPNHIFSFHYEPPAFREKLPKNITIRKCIDKLNKRFCGTQHVLLEINANKDLMINRTVKLTHHFILNVVSITFCIVNVIHIMEEDKCRERSEKISLICDKGKDTE